MLQTFVLSIKRVLTTNIFIIKTILKGVFALTIENLESQKYSLKLLIEEKDDDLYYSYTDTLQLQITPTDIVIATTVRILREGKYKERGVKVMKVKLANI